MSDHTLPSGWVVQQSLRDDGTPVFRLVDELAVDAVDAMALGQLAAAALAELRIAGRCKKCQQFLSADRVLMRIDRCAACDKPRGLRK